MRKIQFTLLIFNTIHQLAKQGLICVLTLAGVGVSSLRRSPRQIVIKVLTTLTVQALCVVVAHTATMDLNTTYKPIRLTNNHLQFTKQMI